MTVNIIPIKGMNIYSQISDSSIGNCEELINVKAENGQLVIDTDYEVVSADIPYTDILVHNVGTQTMYIGKDTNDVVWFDLKSGEILKRFEVSSSVDKIHLATTNNLLVISDTLAVKTTVYAWKEDKYNLIFDGSIKFEVFTTFTQTETSYLDVENGFQDINDAIDESIIIKSIQANLNKFEQENINAAEGGFLMAFTLTMYDGKSEIGPFSLQYVPIECDKTIFNEDAFALQAINATARIRTDYLYRNVRLIINRLPTSLDKYKDVIKNVNLYVSTPISRLDLSLNGIDVKKDNITGLLSVTVTEKPIKSRNIERQLLYLNKSWNLQDFFRIIEYDIVFGGDTQTTSRTMPVTNAHLQRAGKMLTYNSRVHYFDSRVRVNIIDIPSLSEGVENYPGDESVVLASVSAYLFLRTEQKEIVQKFDNKARIKKTDTGYDIFLPEVIIMPDTRAYRLVVTYEDEESVWIKEVPLTPSLAYDYSYAYGAVVNGEMIKGEAPEVTDNIYSEYDIINVSEVNNPVFFPASNSYRTQGNIITLALAIEPISNVQIGTFPLYVFTDKGISVLTRGTGAVLYGDLEIINTDVVTAVTQTKTGVVYIANGYIYSLLGRQVIILSMPIDGDYDAYIRKCKAYSECCVNDKLYNVGNLISATTFKNFLENAVLSYVPATEEIIVSNPNFIYSYVLSLLHKQWHKINDIYGSIHSKSLLFRTVLQNSSAARSAKGRITISSAIIQKAHTFTATASAQHIGKFTSKPNEKYALVISDVQVSASLFFYSTSLAVIMSTLTQNVEYLDDYFDNDILTVYYGLEYKDGTVLRLVNLTTDNDVFSITFKQHNSNVSIPDKGIGEEVVINSTSKFAITADDSVLTIATSIAEKINLETNKFLFSANVSNNIVDLTANSAGAAGNDLDVEIAAGDYVALTVESFSGGKDVTLEPGSYIQIVDFSRPKHADKVIHIQTRPITYGDKYTILSRSILYCKSILSAKDNLSMYVFASNNLFDWECVSAVQRTGISVDHLRILRVARSYKYFVFIIGGKVYSNSELKNLVVDVKQKYVKKLR